jgi:hypothetical protein
MAPGAIGALCRPWIQITLHLRSKPASIADMRSDRPRWIVSAVIVVGLVTAKGHACGSSRNPLATPSESPATPRDGSHDFDFLIGDWKAHVRRLPKRLKGSNVWVKYEGISNHKKRLDSNANFEEFDISTSDGKNRIKAQTLRLYNPESHQWSIYPVDLDKRCSAPNRAGNASSSSWSRTAAGMPRPARVTLLMVATDCPLRAAMR